MAYPCLLPQSSHSEHKTTCYIPRGWGNGEESGMMFSRTHLQAFALTSTPTSESRLGDFFLKVPCIFLTVQLPLYIWPCVSLPTFLAGLQSTSASFVSVSLELDTVLRIEHVLNKRLTSESPNTQVTPIWCKKIRPHPTTHTRIDMIVSVHSNSSPRIK